VHQYHKIKSSQLINPVTTWQEEYNYQPYVLSIEQGWTTMDRDKLQNFYETVYSDTNDRFESYARNTLLTRVYTAGNGKRLLDIGASYGLISSFFHNKGYNVYAMEWDTSAVHHLNTLGVNVVQADVEKTPYQWSDNFFDEVFWGDNIEHLFFPESVASEIYRILKPGGRLVLSTPNHGWLVNRLYYMMMGVPRRTEGHKIPIWEWQHIRYFNKQEMYKFLTHCGFGSKFVFHASDHRQPFTFLSKYIPTLMGSVMVVEAYK